MEQQLTAAAHEEGRYATTDALGDLPAPVLSHDNWRPGGAASQLLDATLLLGSSPVKTRVADRGSAAGRRRRNTHALTVLRDIEQLRNRGFEITGIAGLGGGLHLEA